MVLTSHERHPHTYGGRRHEREWKLCKRKRLLFCKRKLFTLSFRNLLTKHSRGVNRCAHLLLTTELFSLTLSCSCVCEESSSLTIDWLPASTASSSGNLPRCEWRRFWINCCHESAFFSVFFLKIEPSFCIASFCPCFLVVETFVEEEESLRSSFAPLICRDLKSFFFIFKSCEFLLQNFTSYLHKCHFRTDRDFPLCPPALTNNHQHESTFYILCFWAIQW